MKTEKELNQGILELTMKIRNESPELLKYLAELPVTIPDISNPEINCEILADYYDSLKNIIKKYTKNCP